MLALIVCIRLHDTFCVLQPEKQHKLLGNELNNDNIDGNGGL